MSKINIKKLSAVLAVLLLAGLVLAGAGAADGTIYIGEKSGDDFTFSNAVVITKMTLPGATYATVTNTTGSGWYNCSLSTDGTSGTAYFQVPIDVLNAKGYTVNDVSLVGCTTTYRGTEDNYAKYSAPITGSGSYSIRLGDTSSIEIHVVDSVDNQTPIVGASIVITGNGIVTPITGITDSNGFWSYDGLSSSIQYVATVKKTGYFDETVTINGGDIKQVSLISSELGTAKTFFNYQIIDNSDLPAGTYMTVNKANVFVMPNLSGVLDEYYIPGDVYPGAYYLNGNDDNAPVYIQQAGVTYSSLSIGTKLAGTNKFYATIMLAADVGYHIVLKRDDLGVFVKQFPSMGTSELEYPLDQYTSETSGYLLKTEDIGTWEVYAEIIGLKDTAPVEYKYVMLGTLKVVSKIDHTTTATIDPNVVEDGEVFIIAVTAPKGDKIYVGYRDPNDEDSFIKIPVGSGGDSAFYIMNGQAFQKGTSTEPYFEVPATKMVNIAVVADTGLITDKRYTLVIRNPDNTDDDGNQIEIELEITVKGNVLTAHLENASYDFGEDIQILGTYDNSIPLYFYIEGSNVIFQNIHYGSAGDYGTFREISSGIEWNFTIDKLLTSNWNPGIYTIYVSIVKNEKPVGTVYTTAEKAAISASGKVLTLTLTQPVITITSIQNEVGKGKFENVTVEAMGTDKLQAYVTGQNQVKFLNVTETATLPSIITKDFVNGEIFSMNPSASNYLYNAFKLDGTGFSNTISNVLKAYGPTDYYNGIGKKSVLIEDHLVVKNTDGTYSIYIYIPASGWDFGQYYVVVQHPMADGKFNVTAVPASEGGHGYSTGYDIITNNFTFLFNIPAFNSLEAAHKLADAITTYNDKYASGSFWVVSIEEATVIIDGPSDVKIGGSAVFTAKMSDESTATFMWCSSNTSIASVDEDGNVTGLNEGSVTITAENTDSGKSASKTITVTKGIVPGKYSDTLILRAGWNFISVPMTLDSSMNTAEKFFEEVDMDNHSVLGYDSSTKSWVQLTASTVLKPLDAYWVYSKEDFVGTKKIVFDTQSPSIGNTKEIYKGWNAVGLNIDVTDGTNSLSAKSTFAGLDWNRYFEKYSTGSWKVIVNGGSSAESEEKYIYAGAGGWIYANENGTLIGNAS